MSDIKLKLRRGPKDTIPTLEEGELGYTTDSKDLYIGTSDGNKQVNGGGDAIVDSVSYKDAKTTQLYRTTATENLTKATHTESQYTASPSKYYKIDSTKIIYDSETGILTDIRDASASGSQLWIQFLTSDDISDIATESTVDDYDFYLDSNGGYYPKKLHNTYLFKLNITNKELSSIVLDYSSNKILINEGETIADLDKYPVETSSDYWMFPMLNAYGVIKYQWLISYSDFDDDTSIQKDIEYDIKTPYYVVHPYLNCAYFIKKNSELSSDYNVISYKDEFTKSMTDLATIDYVDKSIEKSKTTTLEELTINELTYRMVYDKDLIPGKKYRITDYSIKFNTDKSLSLSSYIKVAPTPHYFDIVVTAESPSTISRFASAMISDTDTSGYYSNTSIDLWKLEVIMAANNSLGITQYYDQAYKLLFESSLIITKMIDEYGNECPYDFKNIVMRRYEITADSSGSITTDMFTRGRYFTSKTSDSNWTIDTTTEYWFYTFSIIFGTASDIRDLSIEMSNGLTKGSNSSYNIFNNNKIIDLFDESLNLFSCYIASDKVNSDYPSSFTCAMFIFRDNILYSGSNTYNTPINNNNYYSIPYSNNIYKGSKCTLIATTTISDCNINLSNQNYISTTAISRKYLMENSSGNMKVFNLADLV